MMGPRKQIAPKLFYSNINLADRIPEDHLLRRINETLDLDFVRREVAGCYGRNGQESIDPVVLMKLMVLLFMEQVPSERERVRRLRYRLDWMWFCGMDFADAANCHRFKRARWRGLVRMRIQNLLIATCQNVRKLLRPRGRGRIAPARMARVCASIHAAVTRRRRICAVNGVPMSLRGLRALGCNARQSD